MKKMTAGMLLLLIMLFTTACNVEVEVYPKDNCELEIAYKTFVNEEEVRMVCLLHGLGFAEKMDVSAMYRNYLLDKGVYAGDKTIDDVDYVGESSGDSEVFDGLALPKGIVCKENQFRMVYGDEIRENFEKSIRNSFDADLSPEQIEGILDNMSFTFIVHMGEEVTDTNGEISEDRTKAIFEVKLRSEDRTYYAYTKGFENPIKVKGAESGYTGKSYISVSSEEIITGITVNGEQREVVNKVEFKEDGKYVVEITTDNASKTVELIRDTKKPKVKGVANGKSYKNSVTITFSDTGSGINSAKLDGKTVKSKTKVKQTGEHTLIVTDKAGNKRTIKFTITKG